MLFRSKPYTKPSLGTTLKVLGVQVLELAAGAVTDSGDLSEDDVIALFAKSAGFKQSAPAPKAAATETTDGIFDF